VCRLASWAREERGEGADKDDNTRRSRSFPVWP